MRLDQEKSKKGDQKVIKKESKLIVEMLKFDQEEKKEDKEIKVQEQPFVLKEVNSFKKKPLPLVLRWFWENSHPLRGMW